MSRVKKVSAVKGLYLSLIAKLLSSLIELNFDYLGDFYIGYKKRFCWCYGDLLMFHFLWMFNGAFV